MTPTQDDINNITTYNFTITTNEEWTFIFEFSPNEAAMVQMDLDFDDPIPEIYDVLNSIKFVNSELEKYIEIWEMSHLYKCFYNHYKH